MRDRGRVDISREPGPRTNCVSLCLLRTPSSLPSPSSTTPTRNYERQTRLRCVRGALFLHLQELANRGKVMRFVYDVTSGVMNAARRCPRDGQDMLSPTGKRATLKWEAVSVLHGQTGRKHSGMA